MFFFFMPAFLRGHFNIRLFRKVLSSAYSFFYRLRNKFDELKQVLDFASNIRAECVGHSKVPRLKAPGNRNHPCNCEANALSLDQRHCDRIVKHQTFARVG